MIRSLVIALLLAVSVSAPSLAAPATAGDAAAMTKTLTDSAVAWNHGDLDRFMESYERSDETAFVTGKGVVRGWEPMREHYRKTYGGGQGLGALSFSDLETTALGPGYAILYGRFHLMRPGAAKEDTGVFDLVMHRSSKGWRIVSDHTS